MLLTTTAAMLLCGNQIALTSSADRVDADKLPVSGMKSESSLSGFYENLVRIRAEAWDFWTHGRTFPNGVVVPPYH